MKNRMSIAHVNNNERAKLNLFRKGFFGAAQEQGGGSKKGPLRKICHKYPAMVKGGTVTPHLKKILKIYESRDTHPEFC